MAVSLLNNANVNKMLFNEDWHKPPNNRQMWILSRNYLTYQTWRPREKKRICFECFEYCDLCQRNKTRKSDGIHIILINANNETWNTHISCNKYQRMWYRKDIWKWKAMKKNCVFAWNGCECVCVCVWDQMATACLCFKKDYCIHPLAAAPERQHIFFCNNIHFPRVNIVTDMVKIIFGDYSLGFIWMYVYIDRKSDIFSVDVYPKKKEGQNCTMSQWWG